MAENVFIVNAWITMSYRNGFKRQSKVGAEITFKTLLEKVEIQLQGKSSHLGIK